MTRAERETVIRWDEGDRMVHIWSASPTVWRKLAKLGIEVDEETRAQSGEVTGRFYHLPLNRLRWGLKRQLSAEHAEAARKSLFRAQNRPSTGRSEDLNRPG